MALRARVVVLVPLLLGGCLPKDTRPPPAEVTVTVSSGDVVRNGIPSSATADGWSIAFQRMLMCLGRPDLGGEEASGCSEYSNPDYTRVFDFVGLERTEEVGIAYALGHCPFAFQVRFPDQDSKLGPGVSERDRTFLRTPGTDAYTRVGGVSVYVEGSAAREGVTKRFAWTFRQRIRYENCWTPRGAKAVHGLTLGSSQRVTANIEIHGEALFQDRLDPDTAKLRFDPFAQADENGDGEVTLDELGKVPLADLAGIGAPETTIGGDAAADGGLVSECRDQDGNTRDLQTLEDFLYCGLVPGLARFDGDGACETSAGPRHE